VWVSLDVPCCSRSGDRPRAVQIREAQGWYTDRCLTHLVPGLKISSFTVTSEPTTGRSSDTDCSTGGGFTDKEANQSTRASVTRT
jgi:hypothetical protein